MGSETHSEAQPETEGLPLRALLRYGAAAVAVAAAMGLRLALEAWVGSGLPTYVTFYPAVMAVAVLAGFRPGLVATVLTALAVAYWVLPPEGFAVGSPVDRLGLALFTGMGLFMCAVAQLYHGNRRKAAAYERELALRDSVEALRAAAERERFLASVVENASQPFAVGYPDGRLGLANRAFEQLTGYTAEELCATNWAEVLTPPEWRAAEQEKLAELDRTGQPVRYEKEYLRKDGTRVPIELLVHLVRNAEGNPEYYYSFVTDITERERAEELLRTRLYLSELAQAATIEALIQTALDEAEKVTGSSIGYFHLVNEDEGTLTLQAWSTNTLQNMCQAEGQGQHYPIAQAGVWVDCLRARAPVIHNDYASLPGKKGLPDGHVPIVRDLGVPVLRSGRVVAIMGVGNKPAEYTQDDATVLEALASPVMDLVAKKQAEEALQRLNAELEHRVADQTAEIRRTYEELRSASLYTRSLLEASLDPLVTISPEGRITDVNQATEAAAGVPRARLVGSDFSDYFTEPGKAREGYQKVLADGFVRDYPLTVRHASGRTADVLYNATVYRNEAGQLQGVFAAARDVTALRAAERRARVTSDLLALFAHRATRKDYLDATVELLREWSGCRCVGIRAVDEQSRIPYVAAVGFDEAFRDKEGCLSVPSDNCICVRTFRGVHDTQDASFVTPAGAFHCNDTAAFLAQLPPETLGRYRAHCMRRGFASLATIPIAHQGQTLGLIHLADERPGQVPPESVEFLEAMAPLIGEAVNRFNAQEAVRRASRYARGLLEASLDPLVTISPEGQITDVNLATEEATGASRDRLIGSDFSDYFTEPDKARQGYQAVISQGLVRDYPLTIRHVSGRTMDVLYNATVYRNEAGDIQGVFAAARDITERKHAEEELAKYREHLEELVQQRTEELARSNRDLEQFAYVASHDLQEPLRVVTGYLQLIDDRYRDRLDQDAHEFIAFAVEGAARMHSLINDLLAYSRVGSTGKPFGPTECQAVLGQAMANLQTAIRESGAAITHGPLPTVRGDATQLVQLLQNLIGNAIKFRGTQPPAIHVGAERSDGRWVFSVRDNGIGIEPQYADRIFIIFQRLHTRDKYPGTGIGLAICTKIVERHGGRIWVESVPGQGSTFFFTLPA